MSVADAFRNPIANKKNNFIKKSIGSFNISEHDFNNFQFNKHQSNNNSKEKLIDKIKSKSNDKENERRKENENENEIEKEITDIEKEKIINNINEKIEKDFGKLNLNKFEPYLDLRDLILLDKNIKQDLLEIENFLLRYLTTIRRIYSIYLKFSLDENKENDELVFSKINIENPFSIKNNIKLNYQNPNNNQVIIPEQIKTNEVSFCISLKDIWFHFRDNGILNENFTIKLFDEIFYNGKNNNYNLYLIPDYINEPKDIYNYVDSMVYEAKVNFMYQYQNYLEYYYKGKNLENHFKILEKKKFIIENSIHYKNNIILPRLFHECLIRCAFIKYYESNEKITDKLKKIINLTIQPKVKKNRSSFSRLDQSFNSQTFATETKLKLQERTLINDFIKNFYIDIQKIFKKLYYIYCSSPSKNNQSISYRFIYNFIIKKSSFLISLIPSKLVFCELITYFYKEKANFNNEELKKSPKKLLLYIENLFDNEIIEYEFFELVYLICKKYFSANNLQGTKKEYKHIINVLNIIMDNSKKLLHNHTKKEKLIIRIKQLEEEEKRKKIESERFNKERKNMSNEDLNVYNENEEYEEDYESEDD